MKCAETRDPFTDERCNSDASVRVWSDGDPNADHGERHEPRDVCPMHARIFEKMITKFYPRETSHVEPITTPTPE